MPEEKEKEKEKEKEEAKYELVEVATQYGIAIQAPDKSHLSIEQALVDILNKLNELQKVL